jgi:hypothetical protein
VAAPDMFPWPRPPKPTPFFSLTDDQELYLIFVGFGPRLQIVSLLISSVAVSDAQRSAIAYVMKCVLATRH